MVTQLLQCMPLWRGMPQLSVWGIPVVALASLVLMLPAAQASTQIPREQVYLDQISTTKWPEELPRDQGERTLEAALDWLNQASDCKGADWLAKAKHVVGEPDATALARTLKTPIAVSEMKMEQAVTIRRCINILLVASDFAGDGNNRSQQNSLALRIYLSGAAPLFEARSQLIDDALTTLQTELVSSESMAWAKTYVPVATQRFDKHLDTLLSEEQLKTTGLDLSLALRRLATGETLSKRWAVEILGGQEMDSPLVSLASLVERLEHLLSSEVVADRNKAALRQIAGEANYIKEHLPAIRKQATLRRDVAPIIVSYLKAIARNDREQLQAVSSPSQVKAFEPTSSMLRTITNSDTATDIKLASIVEVQPIAPTRAKAEVRTIITESSGRAYPSSMTLSLTLTQHGWRVGEPENSMEDNRE